MYINHEIGKTGEDFACQYLEKNNYLIIQRNFRCKSGEIDIIAKDNNEIVFIEVKTRTSIEYGIPIEAVNREKVKHIINTAKYYIYINNLNNCFIRFDVVEVYFKNEKYYIKHHKQVV